MRQVLSNFVYDHRKAIVGSLLVGGGIIAYYAYRKAQAPLYDRERSRREEERSVLEQRILAGNMIFDVPAGPQHIFPSWPMESPSGRERE
jgi:hypothetical protein